MNEDRTFVFHPVTQQIDPSLLWTSDVQYITVEGAQYGDLYLSGQYLMFKSRSDKIPRESKFARKRDEVINKRNKIWHISGLE